MAVDPICGMRVDPEHAAVARETPSGPVYFCSAGCAAAFDEETTAAARSAAHSRRRGWSRRSGAAR